MPPARSKHVWRFCPISREGEEKRRPFVRLESAAESHKVHLAVWLRTRQSRALVDEDCLHSMPLLRSRCRPLDVTAHRLCTLAEVVAVAQLPSHKLDVTNGPASHETNEVLNASVGETEQQAISSRPRSCGQGKTICSTSWFVVGLPSAFAFLNSFHLHPPSVHVPG